MDIIAARQGVQYARKWVTEGNGPLLMEFATYRYGGHSYVLCRSYEESIHSLFYLGCPTLEPPTVLVRRCRGCEARRTLSAVYNATSRNGAWLPSKISRYFLNP